jgi:hypothetical protein
MTKFDPSFLHRVFPSFYNAAFLEVSRDSWGHLEKVFVAFGRFIPFLNVSEMHVIIEHSTFPLIMKYLPKSSKFECFKLFVQRLASFADDRLCQSKFQETLRDSSAMNTRLKFLQAGLLTLNF